MDSKGFISFDDFCKEEEKHKEFLQGIEKVKTQILADETTDIYIEHLKVPPELSRLIKEQIIQYNGYLLKVLKQVKTDYILEQIEGEQK